MSDPAKYRTKEEVASYKDQRDPIAGLGKYLIENKIATQEELKLIEKKCKDAATKAADFALESQEPPLSELYTNIYR